MEDPFNSLLGLTYWLGSGDNRESVQQEIRLVFTEPNYGGRRWWMLKCRVASFASGRPSIVAGM
jgi:hypothetical protein